jgi:phasin family protein
MTPNYSQQIVDGTQANIDTASRIAALMTEATERLLRLQTEAANAAFIENSRNVQALLNKTDSAAALMEWPSLYQANMRRISEVTRNCFEIVSQTQIKVARLMAQYFGAYNEAARQNLSELTTVVNEERDAVVAGVRDLLSTTNQDAATKTKDG